LRWGSIYLAGWRIPQLALRVAQSPDLEEGGTIVKTVILTANVKPPSNEVETVDAEVSDAWHLHLPSLQVRDG
jgi:hypothetical protein